MSTIERDQPIFVGLDRMKYLFDYGEEKLQEWEKSGRLQSGIHFIRIDGGHRRYNVTLIEDLLFNWDDWAAHQKAINNYISALPSNQKSRKAG